MALNRDELSELIVKKLQAAGFVTTGEHAYSHEMAAAVAAAVIEHFQQKAEVNVTEGDSAGTYQIK